MKDKYNYRDFYAINIDNLLEKNAKNLLIQIRKLLDECDVAYHKFDSPIIEDCEYDKLKLIYKELILKYPNLADIHSLAKVGSDLKEGFSRVEHLLPMLSLDNGFIKDDIENFLIQINKFLAIPSNQENEILCEPKIDGLSFSAIFNYGEFTRSATRGDGSEGEDVTSNIKKIKNFPLKLYGDLAKLSTCELRGEIYMQHDEFLRLNIERKEKGMNLFANPRNAAAGSLRQLDPEITARRNLRYAVYGFGYLSDEIAINTQKQFMEMVESAGALVNKPIKICNSLEEIIEFYEFISAKRHEFLYDLDGLVYKVNNIAWQKRLSSRGNSPRWAIAHKFPAEQAQTIIERIVIQVGRTGALTPVAELKPINIGGVVVSRASLHNEEEIIRKNIGEGDCVLVQRAGDVIPQIVSVIEHAVPFQKFIFPENCPVCGSPARRDNNEVVRRCSGGFKCSAQLKERICHFISKSAFDIEGLGEKQIEIFINDNIIKYPHDIFTLEYRNKKNLISLKNREKWGEKSVQNLFASIEKRRNISLEKFIYSLGIRHVGEINAKILADIFKDVTLFINSMLKLSHNDNAIYEILVNISGVGGSMVESLRNFFKSENNLFLINSLIKEVNVFYNPSLQIKSEFSGKNIVFTGTLLTMTRQEAKVRAESMGMRVVNSVSKNTDILVSGENSGSKLKIARDIGINILSEDAWIDICRNQEKDK